MSRENVKFNQLRVLIINPYPIDAECPIGIMMRNLFAEFDADRVLQYYTHQCDIDPNSKFSSKRIEIKPIYFVKLKNLIKSIIIKHTPRVIKDIDSKLRDTGNSNSKWKIWLDIILPNVLKREELEEISKFKPQVIYTQVYSYSMLKLVIKLSNMYSCPIVVHTLDDWMGSHHSKGLISLIPTHYFDNEFRKVLNNGRNHMIASPKMKNYMEKKYGGKYDFVMNCSDFSKMESVARDSKTLKIVYTGGLMLERFLVLDEIAKMLKSMNGKSRKLELHIYAPSTHVENYRDKMQDNIIFHDNIEHNKVIDVLNEADILIHVESFNPNVINFTRYSLSTKIPEYLSAAKPLVYYGPQNIGVAEFLINEKIGISTNSLLDLEKNLIKLSEDNEFYNILGEECFTKGKQILEKKIMRETLYKCLKS